MEHKKEDVLFFPRVWLYARTGSGHHGQEIKYMEKQYVSHLATFITEHKNKK